MDRFILAIDLGGTKILAAVVDQEGRVLARARRQTPQLGPAAVVREMASTAREAMSAAGLRLQEIAALGVGAPGPLDPERGIVFSPPNLRGWEDVPLADLLKEHFPLPVVLENDANAAAAGEWWRGAGRGVDHLVYLTVGTGIGGGLILGGKVYRGAGGLAGEIGHINVLPEGPLCGCGARGCLEAVAAGPAIARMARQAVEEGRGRRILEHSQGRIEAITAQTVEEAAREGDEVAREIFWRAGTYIGIAVGSLINLLNPQRVVIGGGVARAGPLLFDPIQEAARAHSFPRAFQGVEILPALLGEDAGVVGVAAVAFQRLGRKLS
ncbi:MAG: ROK family protein [Armatimonadota bacterium]|nr:ROK family protein [Armatimonadota bacterium]